MPEPTMDTRAVALFLVRDHAKDASHEAEGIRLRVDKAGAADMVVMKRELFYLAVTVRDLAAEVGRLTLAVE